MSVYWSSARVHRTWNLRTNKADDVHRPLPSVPERSCQPKVTPRDLRRTHGSTVTKLGFGRDAMNRVQNHKEGGIADFYDRHGYAAENKRIAEAVASHVISLGRVS
jgi:hypothetical protein